MGTVVKHVLAPSSGLAPRDVLLVGIMPCYDKKLEASRKVRLWPPKCPNGPVY